MDRDAYPEGIEVHCPVQTMSDDFSMAISGIPSMVNDFTSGPFMETHYHTQFDNDEINGIIVVDDESEPYSPLHCYLAVRPEMQHHGISAVLLGETIGRGGG